MKLKKAFAILATALAVGSVSSCAIVPLHGGWWGHSHGHWGHHR